MKLKRIYEIFRVKSSSGVVPFSDTTLEPVKHVGITFISEFEAEQWLENNGEKYSNYIIFEILIPE